MSSSWLSSVACMSGEWRWVLYNRVGCLTVCEGPNIPSWGERGTAGGSSFREGDEARVMEDAVISLCFPLRRKGKLVVGRRVWELKLTIPIYHTHTHSHERFHVDVHTHTYIPSTFELLKPIAAHASVFLYSLCENERVVLSCYLHILKSSREFHSPLALRRRHLSVRYLSWVYVTSSEGLGSIPLDSSCYILFLKGP